MGRGTLRRVRQLRSQGLFLPYTMKVATRIPSNNVHVWFSKHFTGRGCQRTHHLIDSFSSIKGKAHRQWLHSPMEVAAVALSSEGSECIAAGLNHLLIDKIYDDPYSKIIMEMFRLANKTPPEPVAQRGNGCWIKKRF